MRKITMEQQWNKIQPKTPIKKRLLLKDYKKKLGLGHCPPQFLKKKKLLWENGVCVYIYIYSFFLSILFSFWQKLIITLF
jgi:hypothetical protein